MYGAALKNEAGGDGKQEYFCKVPYHNNITIMITCCIWFVLRERENAAPDI
jgi:hypothetical protein